MDMWSASTDFVITPMLSSPVTSYGYAMLTDLSQPEVFIGKIAHLLKLEGRIREVMLLAEAKTRIEQTDYEPYGDGCDIYTIFVEIPLKVYADIESQVRGIQESILAKAKFLLRHHAKIAVGSVSIDPLIPDEPNWRQTVLALSREDTIREVEAQRDLMISVSTGGPRIQIVNEDYKARKNRISVALKGYDLDHPAPYEDLWEWYRKWSSGDLPTYQSRRQYVTDLFRPLLERLKTSDSITAAVFPEPTGWTKIDKNLGESRRRLETAREEIDFQSVGLICRETMITLAQTVFEPNRHGAGETAISKTDAKRMLEGYLSVELSGSANEAARRYCKAALDLANDLTHKRTASFKTAALCAQAMASVVNLIAIVSGQRDP